MKKRDCEVQAFLIHAWYKTRLDQILCSFGLTCRVLHVLTSPSEELKKDEQMRLHNAGWSILSSKIVK